MMQRKTIALDIGGANVKLIDSEHQVRSRAFPLWQRPNDLATELRALVGEDQPQKVLATMTGELADCFRNKREGVDHIVNSLVEAFPACEISVYLTNQSFVTPEVARKQYALASASNWHALATFVGRQPDWQSCILLDIGSTTCDVIPIIHGKVATTSQTDTQRLLAKELVYLGAERTSISSVVAALPYRGRPCPIARELFATMLDVHLLLNLIPDDLSNHDTADGKPATREWAIVRLGRCICADDDIWTEKDAELAAKFVYAEANALIEIAVNEVASRHNLLGQVPVVLSGHGNFMLKPQTLDGWPRVERLHNTIGEKASRCGPAYALLQLASNLSTFEVEAP